MNFIEMFKLLIDGKKVRLPDWKKNDYLHLVDGVILDNDGDNTGSLQIASCWEEYKEPKKQYNFMEAVELIKQGKKMLRPSWHNNLNMRSLKREIRFYFGNCIKVELGLDTNDITATDWEVSE